ncbi:hypothetical protein H500_02275 [Helicobacter pylori CG-IMSS-2012]|nr:hypothetical protein H500_02275 [Helicobacter pylori CG-IMSS-2012]
MMRSFFALKHYFYLNLNKKSRENDIGSIKFWASKTLQITIIIKGYNIAKKTLQ